MEENAIVNGKDVTKHIEKHGIVGIEEFFKAKLKQWKDVEINIGVTGDSGVGMSSFINAIRGLDDDDDENAAMTGITETTTEAAAYCHPTSKKIKFWDLPGIGTPNYPDLETYCNKVDLEKFDTFLILTATRFTENNLQLARKVKSIKKKFFFVRTKIDQDIYNERRKKEFDEVATLKVIENYCCYNLRSLAGRDEAVFLISNHETTKYDFYRLTQAILDALSLHQKESLTLSLDLLTTCSKDLVKRKVEVLRGRIWMVAAASGVGAVVPIPGLSVAIDLTLIANEVKFYNAQLRLPETNSEEFRRLTPELRDQMSKFFLTSALQIGHLSVAYAASAAAEDYARFTPLVGGAIAGGISFAFTYYLLSKCLNELEEIASKFLDETSTRVVEN